jgi:hypothetical protein
MNRTARCCTHVIEPTRDGAPLIFVKVCEPQLHTLEPFECNPPHRNDAVPSS